MRFLVIVVAMCALAGESACAARRYRPAPLSPTETAASLEARTLVDAGLREFYATKIAPLPVPWPPVEWNLAELTVAAFYYNPSLQVARARVAEAEAAILTAGARPNPNARGDAGGSTAYQSPWVAGVGFSIPIETAGKRRDRISRASHLAEAARWNLASTAWQVRSQLRSALLEYTAARQNLDLVRTDERLRAEQVQLFEQRLAVGMMSRPEVDAAAIQHTHALLSLGTAEGRTLQTQASLAAAIGLPVAALRAVKIAWPAFDQPPGANALAPATIREDAVLNRIDIRRALVEYAASEAALRLEIARQYPDFNLGPTYAFEEGLHFFSVALSLALPVFDRNAGPIAEAEARRRQAGAQLVALQASGIAGSELALAKYDTALGELNQADVLIRQSLDQEQAVRQALSAGRGDRVTLNGARLQTAAIAIARLDALYRAQQALGDLENAVQRPLLPGDIQPLTPRSPVLKTPSA